MKYLFLTLLFAVSLGAGAHQNLAKAPQHGDWEKLGTRIINMKADHDVISVTHHEGFYTKLKFVINKAPIYLKNINIIFGNGNNKNVVFNKKFPAGSTTRIIDLPGNKRVIKKINLNYKSVANGNGRAVFVAWGKH